jgi:hypothetical protein
MWKRQLKTERGKAHAFHSWIRKASEDCLMWLEEAKEFVKVCIDGLMLLHRIFSVQNRETEREMVEANAEKIYENLNVARLHDGLLTLHGSKII